MLFRVKGRRQSKVGEYNHAMTLCWGTDTQERLPESVPSDLVLKMLRVYKREKRESSSRQKEEQVQREEETAGLMKCGALAKGGGVRLRREAG